MRGSYAEFKIERKVYDVWMDGHQTLFHNESPTVTEVLKKQLDHQDPTWGINGYYYLRERWSHNITNIERINQIKWSL